MTVHTLQTLDAKVRGVLGRSQIERDELFLFTSIDPGTGFHMRGVSFPLDIAFLDQNFEILHVARMDPQVGTAKAPADTEYAVEMAPRVLSSLQLHVGDVWRRIANTVQISEK